MKKMISFFNQVSEDYRNASNSSLPSSVSDVTDFIPYDPSRIAWSGGLQIDIAKGKLHTFSESALTTSMYRPFSKTWMYYGHGMNERTYQMPKIFPTSESRNLVIAVNGKGAKKGFTAIICDRMFDLNALDAGAQCFPLKLYEASDIEDDHSDNQGSLNLSSTSATQSTYAFKDGITDAGLAHFQEAYPGEKITKEDLFYYVYGLLHSDDYKSRYADNLTKELPRIPRVKTAADFWAFSQAGRALADLHINYETVEPYPVQFEGGSLLLEAFKPEDFRVEQMKFAKGTNGEKYDKTRVIYNHKITMTGIPLAAYDYVVNGKPALEWVMERQAVTTHKESGIVNDANLWALETMGDAAYPLKLFQRVITVSLQTMEIVRSLPKL